MNAPKQKLLLIIILLYSLNVCSQTREIDSLKKVLQVQKENIDKVNTLNELSSALLMKSNLSEAMNIANMALKLSEKINFKKGRGTAYYNIASIYHTQDNIPKAKENYSIALKIQQEVGDKKGLAYSYMSFGQIYSFSFSEKNIPEAMKNYSDAIKIQEQIGDKKGLIESYQNFGSIYTMQENDSKALEYFYKMLRIGEEINDKRGLATALGKIGMVYSINGVNDREGLKVLTRAVELWEELEDQQSVAFSSLSIGMILNRQNKHAEALKHHSKALRFYLEAGSSAPYWSIPLCLENIAESYEKQGDSAYLRQNNIYATEMFLLAKKKYIEAAEIRKKNNDKAAFLHGRLGRIYIKLGDFSLARQTLETSLAGSKAINYKSELSEIFLNLSTLDSLAGNYKAAYKNYRNYILYRDSLINDKNTKTITQTRMEYEFDKKEATTKVEQEKKDLEAKRLKNLQYFAIGGLGVIVLVVLLIAFIQWRHNKQKIKANTLLTQEKEKVESTLSELKATQAQLIQSEKMASLGELTAGIAHEIQNPLNFINNFSDVNSELIVEMKEQFAIGKEQEALMIADDIRDNEQKINHHGKRADAIVKGMLQHARANKGVKELTDINALADEYLRLSYQGFKAKNQSFNATFTSHFDSSIVQILIVPQDIGRVLLNLYNNAFYAMSVKDKQSNETYEPTVSVATKQVGDKVEISVNDNGVGIPQTVVNKIFQPFFTTKPTGEGTGLGLSLSYDIVKAHGGQLKVQTKEGEGTTFIIQLPKL